MYEQIPPRGVICSERLTLEFGRRINLNKYPCSYYPKTEPGKDSIFRAQLGSSYFSRYLSCFASWAGLADSEPRQQLNKLAQHQVSDRKSLVQSKRALTLTGLSFVVCWMMSNGYQPQSTTWIQCQDGRCVKYPLEVSNIKFLPLVDEIQPAPFLNLSVKMNQNCSELYTSYPYHCLIIKLVQWASGRCNIFESGGRRRTANSSEIPKHHGNRWHCFLVIRGEGKGSAGKSRSPLKLPIIFDHACTGLCSFPTLPLFIALDFFFLLVYFLEKRREKDSDQRQIRDQVQSKSRKNGHSHPSSAKKRRSWHNQLDMLCPETNACSVFSL